VQNSGVIITMGCDANFESEHNK